MVPNIHLIPKVFAQSPIPLGSGIQGEGLGPFGGVITNETTALINIGNIISVVVGTLTIISGIWFFIHILIGGFRWVGSQGDKTRLEEAQNRITNAFVGLLIVVAGWSLFALVSLVFGVDFRLMDPGMLIRSLNLTR